MSTLGPDDSPPQTSDELGGLDPKDLFNAALETAPSTTLSPQPADPDATVLVTPSSTSIKLEARQELPLPEELTALLPGGNYHVESFLGQGGMGAVYKGTQVRLKRPVAIKIMRRDFGKDHDFEARFEREAQAMAKLNHPNIVSVIDFGEAGPDYLYIVMELIDGADMMDVIRTGRMTQEMALTLLPQICDALQFAHDHGIIHRDIKPSNIMLTRDGRIKMADFGLAKRFDTESSFRTQTGTGMGTPDYAAPEQFDVNAPIDHRADIYALGVMIYEMITGQLPRGVWKPPSQRAEIAPQWDDIVSRAMQSDPKDRYQQAREVKTDVSSIPLVSADQRSAQGGARPPAGRSAAQSPGQPFPVVGKVDSKSRATVIVGLFVGLAVVALGLFFTSRKLQEDRVAASSAVAPNSFPALLSDAATQEAIKLPGSAVSPSPPGLLELKSSSPFPPGEWVSLFSGPQHLPPDLRKPNSGVKWNDGWIILPDENTRIWMPLELCGNYGIRAKFKRSATGAQLPDRIALRRSEKQSGPFFELGLSPAGRSILIQQSTAVRVGEPDRETLGEKAVPLTAHGSVYELEFVVFGRRLIARHNESVFQLVGLGDASEGGGFICGLEPIRDIEVINLDGLTLDQALHLLGVDENGKALPGKQSRSGVSFPLTTTESTNVDPPPLHSAAMWVDATKDAPFINSLGMRFVPVPIKGGPTDGQLVLFSVWETRVQDYLHFAIGTDRQWPKAEIPEPSNHPVVNVSWEDATAFCRWLTTYDRLRHKLGAHESYRLPTDHEWSNAIGIGGKEDPAQPAGKKNGMLGGVYPWGTSYPPVQSSGNYADEDFRREFESKVSGQNLKWEHGYTDGFPFTAPVGSFSANSLGLYDLGGNVWEWCLDKYDEAKDERVLRGGSWRAYGSNGLLSSSRFPLAPGGYGDGHGFRVVLAPENP